MTAPLDVEEPGVERRLPPGWRWVRLATVLEEAQGGFASGNRAHDGVIQLRMNNVATSGMLDWTSYIRVPVDQGTVRRYLLRPGDVVFNNTNSTQLVGKSAIFTGHDEPVVFSNHFTRLRTKALLDPSYLALWLQAQWRAKLFERICNRWIGQSAVQRDKLLSLEMALPPLPEQRRIAAALTDRLAAVDRMRAVAEARLAVVNDLWAACLRDGFDGKEAAAWPRWRLGDLLRSPLRMGISKPLDAYSEWRCLTLSSVRGGVLDISAVKPVAVTTREAEGNLVQPGVFYVVRGNGNRSLVGRGAIAPSALYAPVLFPDLLIQVDADPSRLLPTFLRWAWDSAEVRRQLEGAARTSAGIYKVNQAILAATMLRVPPLEEQARLAGILSDRTSKVRCLQDLTSGQTRALTALSAALLHEAFSKGV